MTGVVISTSYPIIKKDGFMIVERCRSSWLPLVSLEYGNERPDPKFSTTEEETTIELKFSVLKFKHTVKKKK